MRRPRTIGRRAGRVLRAAALGVAVVVADFGPPATIAQQREEARGGTVTADVALRAEPDEAAALLAVVPNGARVAIDGRAEDGYYPVRYDGLAGWVATGYLASSLDAKPPSPDDADATATDAQDAAVDPPRDADAGRRDRNRGDDVITTEALNLRADPADDADLLRTIAPGDEVVPTGERVGDFVEVRHDGATGWVAFAYLATRRAPTPAALDPSPARGRSGPSNARDLSEAELIRVISDAAAYYGQPRQDMLRVARCESQLTPTAVNPRTGDSGLFQFNPDTWRSTPYGKYDIFDPRASAYAAGWMWSVGRRNEWVCQ